MPKQRMGVELVATDKSKPGFTSYKKGLHGAEKSTQDSSSAISGAWKSGMGKMVLATGGLVGALAALKVGLLDSITAAKEHEDALQSLQTAVEITGGAWVDEAKKVDEFTNAMQRQSRFSNTEMVKTMQSIVVLAGDVEKGYIGTQLAADLASSGLWNLETASRYVALAMSGEITMLARYIPELKQAALEQANVTTQAERADYAIKILTEKFGGTAQKAIGTFGGSMDQLKNAFADVQREVGEILIPVLTEFLQKIIPIVSSVADFVNHVHRLRLNLIELSEAQKAALEASAEQAIYLNKINVAIFEQMDAQNALAEVRKKGIKLSDEEMVRLEALATKVYDFNEMLKQNFVATELAVVNQQTWNEWILANGEALTALAERYRGFIAIEEDEADIPTMAEDMKNWGEYLSQDDELLKQITESLEEMPPAFDEVREATVLWEKTYEDVQYAFQGVTSAVNTGMQSILNKEMTGKQRREAIWRSFTSTVLSQIAMIISQNLIRLATDQVVSTTMTALHLKELAEVNALTAAYIALAAAKAAATGGVGFLGFSSGGLVPAYQHGGIVSGAGGIDNIPAMLSAGEFIMPAEQTEQYLPLLMAMQSAGGETIDNSTSIWNIDIAGGSTIMISEVIDQLIPELEAAVDERRLKLS